MAGAFTRTPAKRAMHVPRASDPAAPDPAQVPGSIIDCAPPFLVQFCFGAMPVAVNSVAQMYG